jgi:hypothetical protein
MAMSFYQKERKEMSNQTQIPTQTLPVTMAVATVYATAFLQGLAMVSFPASATLIKELKGFSDGQYGLIFIPQIITTIAGSLAVGGLALSILMISTFLLLPAAHSAITGITLFGLAGLSCSAFFPLTVGIVSKRFPSSSALVSSN